MQYIFDLYPSWIKSKTIRKLWRYQRRNQKPLIEDGHKIQWRKGKKTTNSDLPNTTQKTKYRATRTPLKTDSELSWFRMVGSLCSTCCSCVTFGSYHNPVLSSWIIGGFVELVTRRVSLLEQELLTLPEHSHFTTILS